MAKISSCYQLCPFMDQKNFLGVSGDCESGYVIVTLGKNIVIRYKISDQRQVNSWNTKIKLSAPVVYDKLSEHYVGVFNSSFIQLWKQTDVELNKMKKYKFPTSIHSILANPNVDMLVVLFKNGSAAPLAEALENRKSAFRRETDSEDSVGIEEVIDDAFLLSLDKELIVVLKTTHKLKKESKLHIRPVQSAHLKALSISLKRDETNNLMGYAFMNEEDVLQLFTIWSDGSLFSLEFSSSTLVSLQSQYPGQFVMNISTVNTQLKVAILPLGPYHIAVYGSDPSEEGALLIIVNVWHRLVQCRFYFKLYCTSPRLWRGGSDDHLLLVVGNHLAVAHFRLVAQQLAALLGTQTDTDCEHQATTLDWADASHQMATTLSDISSQPPPQSPTELQARIDDLLQSGFSEAAIAGKLFPAIIENENIEMLLSLYNSKLVDVPADFYFKTLRLCLKQELLKDSKNVVDSVLSRPVQNDDLTLACARQQFDLVEVVSLIELMTERLIKRPCCVRTIEWATFVVDAFCQQFLFSKDVTANAALRRLRNVIDNQMKQMNVWQELIPLMNFVKLKQASKRQLRTKKGPSDNSIYICEDLSLFEK